MSQPAAGRSRFRTVFGPGLVVMLADSDVGSIITAGQSGRQWGYRLLLLQFALMPVLYIVQELAVRLALFTGRGYGELVRARLGPGLAGVAAAGLVVATAGALLTEFSGVAGVGALFGVPRAVTLPLAAAALLAVVGTNAWRRVERVAIAVGLFELAFFGVAWAAHPDLPTLASQSLQLPLGDPDYRALVAANVGALVSPWMVFYQQSAIAGKRLGPAYLAAARWDTAIGAVVTQLVMAAVLVAAAATLGGATLPGRLDTVGALSAALSPLLGVGVGRVVFGAGVLGAALVAAIVASQALFWGLAEVTGRDRQARGSRPAAGVYVLCVAGASLLAGVAPDLVALNLGVQVMNALLLPLVIAPLVVLAAGALPPPARLRGGGLWAAGALCAATCGLGLWCAMAAL